MAEMRLIFTIPYTNHEILTFIHSTLTAGVAYDPLSTRSPIPWLGNCKRCRRGKIENYPRPPLKTRRAIQALCTATPVRLDGYKITTYMGGTPTHVVHVKRSRDGWRLRTRNPRGDKLEVVGREGRVISTSGPEREFRSPVLQRILKMLLSAREPIESEITSCLRHLPRCPHSSTLLSLTSPTNR
jgi:hypothetical protein